MKKLSLLLITLISHYAFSQNLQLASNLLYPGVALANIGGYVDSLNNEYALVGTFNGLDIVDVTVPTNPIIRFSIPGPPSEWREVKTYRKYAYITTEAGQGLTVVDMSHLPDTIYTKQYTGDGAIVGQLNSIHALHCDTSTGYLYLYGSNINSGNTLFINLADPWNPTYAGEYEFPSGGNDAYVHDGYASNDTLYEAHIYSGFFAVVDVRNKSNPVLLATQTTPTAFTHNTWLSVDHKTLFTTDENSGSYLGAYDISDLSNIRELSRFQTAPGSGAIIHNTHILNDYAVTSWYKEGVVIVDESRPANPIEVAHYDTYPQGSGNGFNGDWGVYPFLPSGTIVASDIDNGLFVLTPTYVRGCYLEGTVSDSLTSTLLNGVLVEILSTTILKTSDNIGEFKTGTAVAGTYDIRFSKPGYFSKTITGVQLNNGVLTALNILLSPMPTFSFNGNVIDSLTGMSLPDVHVQLEGNGFTYSSTSDANGNFNFTAVIEGIFTLQSGKWGYHTSCRQINLSQGTLITDTLAIGYYDDFTFDLGWTISGTSLNAWERGEPVGTYDDVNNEINPDNDVATDCGNNCFVTDNGGGSFSAHDVDNGNTILTSPVFDATIYVNPTLNYSHRYLAVSYTSSQPNDTMFVRLSNGIISVIVEFFGPFNGTNGVWRPSSFPISSLITPTANMQLSIECADNLPFNIVEGAFDQFEISGQLLTGVSGIEKKENVLSVSPNPFSNETRIFYNWTSPTEKHSLIIRDIFGRIVCNRITSDQSGTIVMGQDLNAGIYFLSLDNEQSKQVMKIVKE
jgi:choice-of-anchor B domain-containing protein